MERLVTIAYIKNPFDPWYSREIHHLPPGKTIQEYARDVCGEGLDKYDIVPSVNGCEFLPDKQFDYVCVPGDTLAFAVVPQGGDSGKAILSIVAMVAIMIVAPAAGAYLGTYMAESVALASGWTAGAIAFSGAYALGYAIGFGAVMLAGGLVMSALAPKPPSMGDAQASQTYSWNPTGNNLNEGAALPELFGTHRVIPPVISKFVQTIGSQQYINLLMAVAGHEIDSISSVRINETPIAEFNNVEWATRLGLVTQATILDFDDIRAETAVGVKINSDTLIKTIESATQANPCVITITNHGFSNGDSVWINGVTTMTQLNLTSWELANVTTHTFELKNCNSLGYTAWGSGTGYVCKWTKRTMPGDETADQVGMLLSFPKGVFHANDDGSLGNASVKVNLQYRDYDAGHQPEDHWIPAQVYTDSDITSGSESSGHWEAGYFGGGGPFGAGALQGDLADWKSFYKPSPLDTDPDSHANGDIYLPTSYWYIPNVSTDESYVPGEPTLAARHVWWWIPASTSVTIISGTTNDYVTITANAATPIYRYLYTNAIATGRYELRVCCYEKPTVDTRNQGDVHWDSYQEITNQPLTYPGVALLGVKALATDQLSGGMPKVDCIAVRSQVWIRDASNNRAQKAATNPAWASLYLLQKDGEGIPYDRCDYTAFSNWADYCDDTTGGKLQYTVNIYLDSIQTLRKQLDTISALGRGVIIQLGSKFTVIVDKADTAVQRFSFGMGNIVKDSYREEYLALDDRANAVEVTFFNAANEYERETIEVYASDFDTTEREINKTSVTLIGCTSRDLAIAFGQFLLNCNRYLTQTASWEADVDAIACIPGDVVEVSHDLPQYGFSGRVVSATTNTITLDREVTIVGGTTYQISVRHQATDVVEVKTITSGAGTYTTLSISGTWTNIPVQFANYVFGVENLYCKKFRVINISRAQDQTRKITGIEYNASIYDESATVPSYTDPSVLVGTANIRTNEIFDGGVTTGIAVTWTGNAMMWYVWIKRGSDAVPIFQGTTTSTSFIIRGLTFGDTVTVYVGHLPNVVNALTSQITLSGKTSGGGGNPTTPTLASFNDTLSVFTDMVYLYWAAVNEPMIRGYEVRTDLNWGTATNMIYQGAGTSYVWNSYAVSPTTASYTFYIKTIDTQGQYSATYDTITLTVAVPSAPTGVVIEAGFKKVSITWTVVTDEVYEAVEVWRSATNDRTTSSKIGEIRGNLYIDTYQLTNGGTYYYWLRVRTRYMTYSAWSTGDTAGHQATTDRVTTADIADQAITQIKFATGIVPPKVVTSLPSLPDADYPEGILVFLTTDGKLYRNNQHNGLLGEPEITDIEAFGDSITYGYKSTTPYRLDEGDRFINQVATDRGWTLVNSAVSSTQIVDQCDQVLATDALTDETRLILTGFNDMRNYGTNTAKQAVYEETLKVLLVWLGIPTDEIKLATDASITYTGSWSTTTLWGRTLKYSGTAGDKAEFTLSGSVLYIIGAWVNGNTYGTMTINVDGTDVGTMSSTGAEVSAVSGRYYGPRIFRVTGLENTTHSVTLTGDGAGVAHNIYVVAAAGIDGTKTGKPSVIVGNCLKMNTTGYAAGSPDWNHGSDSVVAAFNTIISGVCTQLSADGLNIIHSDVSSVYDPTTGDVEADNIHPSVAGHLKLSAKFISTLDTAFHNGWTAAINVTDLIGNIGGANIAPGTIVEEMLAPGSVTGAKFAETIVPPEVVDTLPTLPDANYPEGKIVYLTTDGKLYRNDQFADPAGWSAKVAGGDLTANSVTAGKIEAGAIGTDQLAARAVLAKNMVIADTANLVSDPLFSGTGSTACWEGDGSVVAKGTAGVPANAPTAYVIKLGSAKYLAENITNGIWHDCTPGEEYYVSAEVASDGSATSYVLARILWYDKDGSFLSASDVASPAGASVPWQKIYDVFAAPANARRFIFQTSAAAQSGYWYIAQPRIRKAAGGELIVDGSINAVKIASNAVLTQHLVVANFDNIITNPNGKRGTADIYASAGVTVKNYNDSGVPSGCPDATCFKLTGVSAEAYIYYPDTTAGLTIDVQPGESYYIECYAACPVGTTVNIGIGARLMDRADQNPQWPISYLTPTQTWTKHSYALTIPSGMYKANFLFDNITTGTETWYVTKLYVRKMQAGELIVDGTLSASKIVANDITAGQIAAGAIGVDELAANSVVASKMVVTGWGAALNIDPNVGDTTAWSGANYSLTTITDGKVGKNVAQSTANSDSYILETKLYPVDPDKVYRVRVWVRRRSTANGTFYALVDLLDSSLARIGGDGTYWYYWASGVTPTNDVWTCYTGRFGTGTTKGAVPANARYMRVGALMNYGGTSGYYEIQDIRVEEAVQGELIVDGAITSAKLATAVVTLIDDAADTALWSGVTGTGKPADNADVTLTAVNNTLTITGGGITLSSGGAIKGGQTDYDTGTGFFLGYSGSAYKLSVGTTNTYLKWDGTNLNIGGTSVSNNGSYMVSVGKYCTSLTTQYPTAAQFTNDGQTHYYVWASTTWVEVANIGKKTSGSDYYSIYGFSNDGASGYSAAVCGLSQPSSGSGYGVYGIDQSTAGGSGIAGYSTYGYGLTGSLGANTKAPLYLVPYGSTPPSHTANKGSIYIDTNGNLYVNINGSSGYSAWKLNSGYGDFNSYGLANGSIYTVYTSGYTYVYTRSNGAWVQVFTNAPG